MANWAVWKGAFDLVNLRDDGDPVEIRGSTAYNLDKSFTNYEVFWRYHIVAATNRPANVDLRKDAATEIGKIGLLSHSIFVDIVNASDSLVKIQLGDLGGDRFRNCTDAIKSDGDAVQKFTDLQNAVQGDLATNLNSNITIWSQQDWQTKWSPSREKIIGYRNFLTHMGNPQVMLQPLADGTSIPLVLHPDNVQRGAFLTWQQQEELHETHPEKWVPFSDACRVLHESTIIWLNDAYGELIRALEPFLGTDDYCWLWGWDTPKHGRHICKETPTSPATSSTARQMRSGSGIATTIIPGSGQGGG